MEAFSYSISHDLRAPLRGIIGFTTMLDEKYGNELDDEARRIITVIKSNTLRMGSLIDDLLSFSRMGRQDIIKGNIPINNLVKEVITDLAGTDHNIYFNIQSLPDGYGDINTLRRYG